MNLLTKKIYCFISMSVIAWFSLYTGESAFGQSAADDKLHEDFGHGSLKKWIVDGNDTTKIIKLKDGNHVGSFQLNTRVDGSPCSALMAKFPAGRFDAGKTYSVSFRTNLVSFKPDTSKDTIFQLFDPISSGTRQGAPNDGPISLFTENGLIKLKIRDKVVYTGKYTERTWDDWYIHVKLAAPGKNGQLSLVRNGRYVVNVKGANLYSARPHQLEIGICNSLTGKGSVTRDLYMDEIAVDEYLTN